MSKSNHSEAQMIGALKQLEAGRKAEDVAREVGVSKHTIYAWKAKYAGAPSFAQFAKGGYHERMRNRLCTEEQKLRRQHRHTPLQRTQGWGTLSENDVHKSR